MSYFTLAENYRFYIDDVKAFPENVKYNLKSKFGLQFDQMF